MFGFLKRKLGDVVKKFSKEVEDESEVIEVVDELKSDEVVAQDSKDVKKKGVVKDSSNVKSKKKVSKPIVEKDVVKEKVEEDVVEEVSESADSIDESVQEKSVEEIKSDDVVEKEVVDVESSKKGFFSKFKETFTKIKLSDEKFEELFWDLEVALLENNVALEVIQKIKDDLKNDLTQDKISRKNVQDTILDSLRNSIKEVLSVEKIDFLKKVNSKKPFVIAVIGVNGSGKTTTIAKLCYYLKKNNKSLVLAAADTFRAAAIQQIEHHAQNLDVKLIKHDYNSDPSAVAFDAIRHAEAKNLDVVVIDTAGRLHSNDNLMNELKKLVRVNKPDLKLFVGESITGNDCVEQARKYDEIIGIDAIVLSKADIDEKGGAALSISYVTKKPVLFIGTGQNYEDLEIYDEQKILSNLGI
ncbi:signal recognition particle-docking protein FtsY [Candidatus Woesearchaeota archaeon]|nr:signal recognition particle-docking protein FtsY [Candidatus Woesearchaeota archaeon]